MVLYFKKGTQTSGRILLHRNKTVKGEKNSWFLLAVCLFPTELSALVFSNLCKGSFAWRLFCLGVPISFCLLLLAPCLSMGCICWSHGENGLTVNTAISLLVCYQFFHPIAVHPAAFLQACSLWDGFFLHMCVVLLKIARPSWEIVWLRGHKCGASLCLIPLS